MIELKTKYLQLKVKEANTDQEKRVLINDLASAMNLLMACQTMLIDEEFSDGNVHLLGRDPGKRDH